MEMGFFHGFLMDDPPEFSGTAVPNGGVLCRGWAYQRRSPECSAFPHSNQQLINISMVNQWAING
jgi:hypothetical protein